MFRNIRNAIYLRDNERNREYLARIAAYYTEQGISFDPSQGFDPVAAAESAPIWAQHFGVVPRDYRTALRSASGMLG